MKILNEEIPLLENLKTSLEIHNTFWAVLIVTAVFDFATTILFMRADGIDHERNLMIRFLAETLGMYPGVVLGKILQLFTAIGFAALSLKYARAILLLLIMLNSWAVIINLM